LLSVALQEGLQQDHLYCSFNFDKSDSVSHSSCIIQISHSAFVKNVIFVHKTFPSNSQTRFADPLFTLLSDPSFP